LLLLCGFVVGPAVLDWLPAFTVQWFPVLTDIALAMIGFLLGHNLTRRRFKELGRPVLIMSLGEVMMTAVLVFTGLALLGLPTEVALLLAGIAPATAPAAIVDVVHAYRAKGRFTDALLGIVAIDDAWGLLLFSLLLAAAQAISGLGDASDSLLHGLRDVGGALLLGIAVGLPMALITGRVRPGEPSQAEALGLVLLCAGLAEWFAVSYILSAIVLGAVVANTARHHQRPFRAIEGIEWPFLVLFFLLAGAALHVDMLAEAGALTLAYIGLRVAGRLLGIRGGGRISGSDLTLQRWMGLALLPQAGVAIGMALIAAQRFPEIGDLVLSVVLASTVCFELAGPIATRWALARVGEIAPR
jgi:Kef-type K+ transport system membrane component KefB